MAVEMIAPEVAPRGWSRGHRFAFRFVLAYLVCYNLPFPLDVPPKTQWLDDAVTWCWHKLGVLVGDLVFGVKITVFSNGSGDTTYDYVMLFTMGSIAMLAAIAWTVADRRRIDYRKLDAALRVYVRYVLGFTMMSYGFAKVFKTQFPFPSADRLNETYGESSPMGLLWTMMGYSPGYNLFTGGIEVLGGLLLLWRRTALLGSIVSAGALANIVALNVFYDVPVKLYSTHLLLMSVYVMAPDLGRLAAVVVLNRPVAARPPPRPLSRRMTWAKRGVKVALIGYALYAQIDQQMSYRTMMADDPSPVAGLFVVERFARDGVAATDAQRWHTFGVSPWGGVVIRSTDAPRLDFYAQVEPAGSMIVLVSDDGAASTFLYSRRGDRLHLLGVYAKHLIDATLVRRDESELLLVSRGFHWINEYPLNR
jgi:hypothetical protein